MPGLFKGIDDEDPVLHMGFTDLLKSPDLGASRLASDVSAYVEKMIWHYQAQLESELRAMNVERDQASSAKGPSSLVQRPTTISEKSTAFKENCKVSFAEESPALEETQEEWRRPAPLSCLDSGSKIDVTSIPSSIPSTRSRSRSGSRMSWFRNSLREMVPSWHTSPATAATTPIGSRPSSTNMSSIFSFPAFLRSQEEVELMMMNSKERSGKRISKMTPAPMSENQRNVLLRLVSSNHYERFLCILILSNAIFMGVEIASMTGRGSAETTPFFTQCEVVYCVVFSIELALRAFAHGSTFFTSPADRPWNVFELIIVGCSIIQTLVKVLPMSTQSNPGGRAHVQSVQVLRSVRALRILRLVVTVRGLRPLRLLVNSIMSTLGACFWILVLLAFIVYIFGLAFTNAALIHLASCDDCNDDTDVSHFFGTLSQTLVTLFQSVCGGVSWREPMIALGNMGNTGGLYVAIFLMYITFTYFAVLNVVTALFCQHAVENSMADQDVLLEKKQEGLSKIARRLENLFHRLDEIDSEEARDGMFTFGDLKKVIHDDHVVTDFALLGLEPGDAWTLFKLIDVDNNGTVEMDEFVKGCINLRGSATKMDIHLLLYENQYLFSKLDGFMHFVFKELTELSKKLSEPSKHMKVPNSHYSPLPKRRVPSDTLLHFEESSVGSASPGRNSPQQPASPRALSPKAVDFKENDKKDRRRIVEDL